MSISWNWLSPQCGWPTRTADGAPAFRRFLRWFPLFQVWVRVEPPAVRVRHPHSGWFLPISQIQPSLFSLSLHFPHFLPFSSIFAQEREKSFKLVHIALKLGKSKVKPRNWPQISSSPPIWYSFHSFSLSRKLRFLDLSGFHFKPEICVWIAYKLAPWASLLVSLPILSRFHLDFGFQFLGFSCQNLTRA